MKIERIDDKTIKCYISMEELEEYEVDYHDFLSRNDKAQRLMSEIMEEAKEQLDYEPPKKPFEIQIMMVPEQGMVLTFSEKDPMDLLTDMKLAGFMQNLQSLIEHISQTGSKTGSAPNMDSLADKLAEKIAGSLTDIPLEKEAAPVQIQDAVFCFDNIAYLMNYADSLPRTLRVESRLYKMDDYFYLYMHRGGAAYDKFSKACGEALEFSTVAGAGDGCEDILREHAELIIGEKALRKLHS